jgi:hypothetical protein
MTATFFWQQITGLAACALLTACAPSRPAHAAPAPTTPDEDRVRTAQAAQSTSADSFPWLVVDSAARSLTLDLEVSAPAGSPSALINGYRAGEMRIVVPVGWTIRWKWRSSDAAAPHSLVVMVQREKIPLEGGRPSFSNAMTRMVTEGLRPGQTDQSTFLAEEAGWYWMMCGVPSHGLNGEWLELRVDPDAKTATAQEKKR